VTLRSKKGINTNEKILQHSRLTIFELSLLLEYDR